MSKEIDIKATFIDIPIHITIDGKNYPITNWNIKVVQEYWNTNDETVLDKLKDFALEF